MRANLINVRRTRSTSHLGMQVQLATQVIGTDDNGTEAIGFGFEPSGRLSDGILTTCGSSGSI